MVITMQSSIMIFGSDCSICLIMCIILSIRVLIFVLMITSKCACLYTSLWMLYVSITSYFCVCGMLIPEVKRDQNKNKTNVRDLIASPGLVILLKLYSNRGFFSPCDLEIWWMTSKNNTTHLLYYIKLCESLHTHQWIQTGVTVWKRSIRVKSDDLLSRVTSKFDGWPWKTIGHLFYTTSSFVHHLKVTGLLKLELQSGNAQSGSKWVFFSFVALKFDRWPWKQ